MSTHYDSLADYTTDVLAARAAYRADQLVAAGICPTCERRKSDTGAHCRECWACRHGKRPEVRRGA